MSRKNEHQSVQGQKPIKGFFCLAHEITGSKIDFELYLRASLSESLINVSQNVIEIVKFDISFQYSSSVYILSSIYISVKAIFRREKCQEKRKVTPNNNNNNIYIIIPNNNNNNRNIFYMEVSLGGYP